MNYDSKMMSADGTAETTSGPETHAMVDAHSVRAREEERMRLRADIDAFLAQGGKVKTLEPNRRTDLPKAPQNNYGKGPI